MLAMPKVTHHDVKSAVNHKSAVQSAGKDDDETVWHLFQRLGVLLAKGNSALLINRVPSFPLPEVDSAE